MAAGGDAFPNAWQGYAPRGGGYWGGGGRGGKGRGGKGRGGKGRGGRGGGWDAPADFSSLGEERRAELEGQVRAFRDADGPADETLPFPASLSPLERRFVHDAAERLGGLVARGVGAGAERRIVVTRGAAPAPTERGDVGGVPAERQAELEAAVEALLDGVESGARPRVGDAARVVRVLGADALGLEGRVGEVVGVAPLSGGAVSLRFEGDGAAFGEEGLVLTVAADDVRVVEATRPLPEGSVSFPKSLTGLERKVVHAAAEKVGLVSQSFGEGRDRCITVFRPAGFAPAAPEAPSASAGGASASASGGAADVRCSVVELDDDSRARLLEAIGALPDGWRALGSHMVLCQGPLARPTLVDRRSIGPELLARLAALSVGSSLELRVVSLARGEQSIAVGILGAPSLARTPHVAVAAAPGAAPWAAERLAEWAPWLGAPLLLRGAVAQWGRRAGAADAPPAAGAEAAGAAAAEAAESSLEPGDAAGAAAEAAQTSLEP